MSHRDGEAVEIFGAVEPDCGDFVLLLEDDLGVGGRLGCYGLGQEVQSVHGSV
jgi:hypothetical protein